jgi:hypothetical protein
MSAVGMEVGVECGWYTAFAGGLINPEGGAIALRLGHGVCIAVG